MRGFVVFLLVAFVGGMLLPEPAWMALALAGHRVREYRQRGGLMDPILNIETEQERPRRWIAEVPELPGVMVYGRSQAETIRKVISLSIRVTREAHPFWAPFRKAPQPAPSTGGRPMS